MSHNLIVGQYIHALCTQVMQRGHCDFGG
jgi:hypothetical protein